MIDPETSWILKLLGDKPPSHVLRDGRNRRPEVIARQQADLLTRLGGTWASRLHTISRDLHAASLWAVTLSDTSFREEPRGREAMRSAFLRTRKMLGIAVTPLVIGLVIRPGADVGGNGSSVAEDPASTGRLVFLRRIDLPKPAESRLVAAVVDDDVDQFDSAGNVPQSRPGRGQVPVNERPVRAAISTGGLQ